MICFVINLRNFNNAIASVESEEDRKQRKLWNHHYRLFFIDSMREVLIPVNRISVIILFNYILKMYNNS